MQLSSSQCSSMVFSFSLANQNVCYICCIFLPCSYGELVAYAQTNRNKTYICKPETGCQGRGIYVTKHIKEIKPQDKLVCQVYISKVSSNFTAHKIY
jgi:hypothetical protein